MTVFDPYAPSFVEDPYPVYARLRAAVPVFFDERWGITFFTRHRDVREILRDRRFGRDPRSAVPRAEIDDRVYARIYPAGFPHWTRLIRESFLDLEPPGHTRIRRLVQQAFTRRAVAAYRPRLVATADAALDAALARGRMEAIADYATPIPLAMISELMGIPAGDRAMLVDWSHRIVRLFDEAATPDEGRSAEDAVAAFAGYLLDLIPGRRRRPGDDLISALLNAEADGDRLSEEEVVATSILTLNAGHEATVQAIGNALVALARWPGEYRRLRDDPALVPTAVEETLRYDPPLTMFERWVLEDVDRDGVLLRRGTKVGLLFASANHDEEVFTDPERLDVARADNPHVSFGGGIHLCVGAPLARAEMEVALERLAARVARFEVETGQLERVPSLVFRGVRELPLRLTAA